MRVIECGRSNNEVIVLLHGTGLSWWQYRRAARSLSSRFHVVMPVLDGHAGSSRNFNGIDSNAREIISYIDKKFGGSVLMICGMSLGGQVLLEMMSVRKGICRYALVESTPVLSVRLKSALAGPLSGVRKFISDTDLVSVQGFRLTGLDSSVYRSYMEDTSKISYKNYSKIFQAHADYEINEELYQTEASVFFAAGDREDWLVKGSAVLLSTLIKGSKFRLFKDYRYGDLSIKHPDEYVDLINEILQK